MRHNQNRRSRGRSGRKGPNPLTRAFESNGPDVKVRGTAAHIAEKYMALARDALASGDNVAAENYFQHAEHYNRIIAAAQAQAQQGQPDFRARDGGDEDSYDGERQMNGRSMEYGRDDRGYQAGSEEDADEAPSAPPRQSRQQQAPERHQQGSERQAESPEQPAAEPEQRTRRRRPRGEEQAEGAGPRGREKRAAAGPNGAGEGDEETTHDGQAALAAFPD